MAVIQRGRNMWHACWAAWFFLDGYALCRLLATGKQSEDCAEWRQRARQAMQLLQNLDVWLNGRWARFPGVLDGSATRVLPLRHWAPTTDAFDLYRLGLYLSMSCQLAYVASTSWTKAWLRSCSGHLRDKSLLDVVQKLNLDHSDSARQGAFNNVMDVLSKGGAQWLLAPTQETSLRPSVEHTAFIPDQHEETCNIPALFIVFRVDGFPAVLCVGPENHIAALQPPPWTNA